MSNETRDFRQKYLLVLKLLSFHLARHEQQG
jgi:hypothetical protein